MPLKWISFIEYVIHIIIIIYTIYIDIKHVLKLNIVMIFRNNRFLSIFWLLLFIYELYNKSFQIHIDKFWTNFSYINVKGIFWEMSSYNRTNNLPPTYIRYGIFWGIYRKQWNSVYAYIFKMILYMRGIPLNIDF